jgi:hypothetical protein
LLTLATGHRLSGVRTLTVEEAISGLGKWLELAMAGEGIRIRRGNAVVELRPVQNGDGSEPDGRVSPREALRQLQADARLTPDQAQAYLEEVQEERLAAETRRPA